MARTATATHSIEESRLTLRRPGGTRLWRTAKLVLPTIATLAILLLIFWSQSNLEETRFRIGITELSRDEIDRLNMLNLRFDGMDKDNRPFSVTADVASQNKDEEGIIDLVEPRADITLSDGAWVALMAGAGHYDRDANRLDLSEGVNVFHDKGLEMSTEAATIDLLTGATVSDTPTQGQGPAGLLHSAGFLVENDGARIVLRGPARLNLFAAGEEQPDGAGEDAGGDEAPE